MLKTPRFMMLWLFAVLLSTRAFATEFNLPTLDPSQTDPLLRTLAASMVFRPVQPASSLGSFGFSLGATGISTSTGQISSIVGSGAGSLYDADISAMLQLPFGLAVEGGFIPPLSFQGTSINRLGLDVKWTFTDVFFTSLPFSMAVRGGYTNGFLSNSQTLNGGNVTANYNTNIVQGNLSASVKLLILEPYVGYGFVQHSSTLSGSGTANLFNGNFAPGTNSISSSGTSGWFQGGVQLKLTIFTIAAEYDNIFSSDSFAGRVAIAF